MIGNGGKRVSITDERLLRVAESLPAVIYVSELGSNGRWHYVSPQLRILLGFEPEEWINNPALWFRQVHPEDRARVLEHEDYCRRTGAMLNMEYRIFTKDGRLIWLNDLGTPMPAMEENTACYQGLLVDISERKRVEEAEIAAGRVRDAISRAQSLYVLRAPVADVFSSVLDSLLALTSSQYGFIGEVLRGEQGEPYLKTHAITNIAWNDETRQIYQRYAPNMEFRNLKTLFGAVMTEGKPVISNDPATDPRRGGLPHGHPPLEHFLGLPMMLHDRLAGIAGIANRPGGYQEPLVDYLRPLLTACAGLMEAIRERSS